MKKINPKQTLAFTLAEVLITLGIIGVVAALTIPTLQKTTSKIIYVAQLKTFYSTFNNGIKKYMVDEGCIGDLSCTGLFQGRNTEAAWEDNIDTAFRKIFKIVESYPTNSTAEIANKQILLLSKGNSGLVFSEGHVFVMENGALFMIYDAVAGNCSLYSGLADPTAKLKNLCGVVYVDINGTKPPSVTGKDVFYFYIANNGLLYPLGDIEADKIGEGYWRNVPTMCGNPDDPIIADNVGGEGCAARIMEEGWSMNYEGTKAQVK